MTNKKTWVGEASSKEYLTALEIPSSGLIVTIKSAAKQIIENPQTHEKTEKLVIYFQEQDIKPMVCNVTNAEMIVKVTKQVFIEDTIGFKIKLIPSVTKIYKKEIKGMQDTDCIRVAETTSEELMAEKCSEEQIAILQEIATSVGINLDSYYKHGIKASQFGEIKKRLEAKKMEGEAKELKNTQTITTSGQ